MKKILSSFLLVSIVVISSVLLSGCTISDEKINEYNRMVSEADILIEGREYTLAIGKLSTATELSPSKVDATKRIVDIFILKNRLEEATKIIDDSGMQLSETDRADLYISVGDAYYVVENYEKALLNYQLAKGLSAQKQRALLGIAKTYLQTGKIEEAKSTLKSNFDGDILIESKLLLSYIEALTDSQEAKQTIEDIEPGDTWRDAYTKWNGILDSLTTDELYNGSKLGKEYLDSGYPYLAISLLQPNLEKMGEYADGIYILGKAYYDYGEYQKSIDVLEENTSLSDLNQYIYWVLASDYNFLGDANTSMSYYDSAIAYGAKEAQEILYTEYLDILVEDNLTEKALEVMKSAERIFAKEWISIYYMDIYSLREDNEKFIYYMNKVSYDKLSETEKPEYLFSKGKYLIKTSKLDEAQLTLDVFWELDQYDPRYNLLVGQLNFEKGELEEARVYAKKAIEYDLEGIVSNDAQTLLAQID